MTFEKDIFISYAHIDDAPLIEGEKGWISEFHRSLELRLAQLIGRKLKIWRDPKLQGNDYFSDEILQQFPQIALLISILSPRYVKSDWCIKEINHFFEASAKNMGVRVANKSRIFKVVKTPVRRDEHPELVRNLLGYDFFKIDTETGRAREFSKIFGKEIEQSYWQKIDDLAYDIRDLLEMLSKESDSKALPEKEGDKPAVYLAETTYELKEYYDAIRRELHLHGYIIYPDQSLPLIASELNSAISDMLGKCVLSVHLVGSKYGIVPEGTEKSVIEIQNDLASAKSQEKNLQRLIWIVPNSIANDERQVSFLESLKNDSVAQAGADLLTASLEEVKCTILDKLKQLEKPKDNKPLVKAETPEGPPQIYLICDQKDLESNATRSLEDYLFEQGLEVILPVFEGEESQVRIDHQENLKVCTGTIVFYGQGNELWLRSKLRDFMKVAGYGRTEPLEAKAVYIADPSNAQKERFRSHEVMVINGLKGFNPELMESFMSKVMNDDKISVS